MNNLPSQNSFEQNTSREANFELKNIDSPQKHYGKYVAFGTLAAVTTVVAAVAPTIIGMLGLTMAALPAFTAVMLVAVGGGVLAVPFIAVVIGVLSMTGVVSVVAGIGIWCLARKAIKKAYYHLDQAAETDIQKTVREGISRFKADHPQTSKIIRAAALGGLFMAPIVPGIVFVCAPPMLPVGCAFGGLSIPLCYEIFKQMKENQILKEEKLDNDTSTFEEI